MLFTYTIIGTHSTIIDGSQSDWLKVEILHYKCIDESISVGLYNKCNLNHCSSGIFIMVKSIYLEQ